jgi:hypothetical protein
MYKLNICYIVILCLLQGFIINPLEKVFFQTYFSNKECIYRPNAKLQNKHEYDSLGIPSGHAETIVIFCLLLYKKIPMGNNKNKLVTNVGCTFILYFIILIIHYKHAWTI